MADIIAFEPRREPSLARVGEWFVIAHDPHRDRFEIIGTADTSAEAVKLADRDDFSNDRQLILAPVGRIMLEGRGPGRRSHIGPSLVPPAPPRPAPQPPQEAEPMGVPGFVGRMLICASIMLVWGYGLIPFLKDRF